jgi:glycosyltransferase involved in cell wall biosynthesis
MVVTAGKWICCQIGARQHYAVPFSLQYYGALESLITDFWCPPGSLHAALSRDLAGRFHPGLKNCSVLSLNRQATIFEAEARARQIKGWRLIERRNAWFQERALQYLARYPSGQFTLHSFSYAALELFQFAQTRGWPNIVQQIDPGPLHEAIVADLYERHPGFARRGEGPSARYWERWRQECALAHQIIVNSEWSKTALKREGIAEKVRVIPLAYEPSAEAHAFQRTYPSEFTRRRPFRVLFLGQLDLGKGIYPLLRAALNLQDEPIEFWFVGSSRGVIPPEFSKRAAIRWFGAVSRKDVPSVYRQADVFIFPTFSDGFGLTQLEAQAWKLPVIASRYCGDVVRNGVNGVLLEEVSEDTISRALLSLLNEPDELQALSRGSGVEDRFRLAAVGRAFLDVLRV